MIRNVQIVALVNEFAEWCSKTGRTSKALAGFERFTLALAKLDNRLQADDTITTRVLSEWLSPDEYRRAGILIEFLASKQLPLPDQSQRHEQAERHRIDAILEETKGKPWGKDIAGYLTYLRDAKTPPSLRSQRMYVRAAIGVINDAEVDEVPSLTQEHVKAYLRRTPGQRNSLSAFLGYLTEVSSLGLTAKSARKHKGMSIRAATESVAQLMNALKTEKDPSIGRALLAKLLSVAHGIPLNRILELRRRDLVQAGADIQVVVQDEPLTLHVEIAHLVRWWLLESVADRNPEAFVFRGRASGESLSTDAVRYHVKRLGKPAE